MKDLQKTNQPTAEQKAASIARKAKLFRYIAYLSDRKPETLALLMSMSELYLSQPNTLSDEGLDDFRSDMQNLREVILCS